MAAVVSRIQMVKLLGAYTQLAAPAVLYHGTCSNAAAAILTDGLQYQKGSQQSMASRGGNYLTTNLAMAASYARSRAFCSGGKPVVFSIQTDTLSPDSLQFDLNLCGRHWSEALMYQAEVLPNQLTLVDECLVPAREELILLTEPEPGIHVVAVDLSWEKANLFC